ncbi:MAG: hypothetical protein WKG01_00560 [Kofleriaceae bacterium]
MPATVEPSRDTIMPSGESRRSRPITTGDQLRTDGGGRRVPAITAIVTPTTTTARAASNHARRRCSSLRSIAPISTSIDGQRSRGSSASPRVMIFISQRGRTWRATDSAGRLPHSAALSAMQKLY